MLLEGPQLYPLHKKTSGDHLEHDCERSHPSPKRSYPYFIVDRIFADPNLELCISDPLPGISSGRQTRLSI